MNFGDFMTAHGKVPQSVKPSEHGSIWWGGNGVYAFVDRKNDVLTLNGMSGSITVPLRAAGALAILLGALTEGMPVAGVSMHGRAEPTAGRMNRTGR